jgi:DNA-binding response OmpR family regulator
MARILIIDDDEDIREILASVLGRLGHEVREAGDGAAGLKLYRQSPVDLVITDLVMPEKEGLSTIMDLRKLAPQARIIAISGGLAHDPKLYLHMAEKLGADRILRKPFHLPELEATVAETLALRRPAAG